MFGFHVTYIAERLPSGANVMVYDDHGVATAVIVERALLADPVAVVDELAAHVNANVHVTYGVERGDLAG